MTKKRRYEAHHDALNDKRIEQAVSENRPCTIGQNAHGQSPLEWAKGRKPEVWAWIIWRDGPATKIPPSRPRGMGLGPGLLCEAVRRE